MFKNISKEEITIPASMLHLSEVRAFIEHIGKKYKFAEKITNSFKLVVDESCTNIIRHGYADIKDGKITIRTIIRRLSLTVIIIDQGKSFDPRTVKDPDLNKYVQMGKKGGLGIFMMRKLMDDIQYNLTAHGNELRLTKKREEVKIAPVLEWYESLSMRNKYFILTFAAMALLTTIIYSVLSPQLDSRTKKDIFSEVGAITKDFAKINWEPLSSQDDLLLYENAKSFQENRSEMVRFAIITGKDLEVVASYPINQDFINVNIDFSEMVNLERSEDVTIYFSTKGEHNFYCFVSPIILKNNEQTLGEPIGFAILWIEDSFVKQKARALKNSWLIFLFIVLVIGTAGIALLVTQITQPFHKLADWVRQVGRGQMDTDEIDIDASDEIGEIAQAFSEVTNKFRDAQVTVIEQQRLQKELQVAQEIQQMLLPDDFPEIDGYDIASYYQSAKEVGGDLFDFMEVDDKSMGICVADVSGKGIPGSLVMTMIRTSLRLEARANKNPAEILAKVNGFVTEDMRKGMFVTMLYVIVDSRERIVSFASAGHNPMILFRAKSKDTYYLNPTGFPVGISLPDKNLFGEKIQMDRIRLHPDDIFVLYTDGITEAMNSRRELYSEERFLAAIRKYGHLDVTEFVKKLKDDILAFTGGFEQNDDITLVAIKENMAAVDVKLNMFKGLFEHVHADNKMTVAEACKEGGISPTTYYRYKRIYQEGGYDLLREMLHGYTNLGLRHLSIEVKTKMYDIIRQFPEYGPKKISDLLNTEKYSFTEMSPLLIYEELKRAKLNTKELRKVFIKRGGKQRLKPPGTPLLTLDGEVLVGFRSESQESLYTPYIPPIAGSGPKEKILTKKSKISNKPNLDDRVNNSVLNEDIIKETVIENDHDTLDATQEKDQ